MSQQNFLISEMRCFSLELTLNHCAQFSNFQLWRKLLELLEDSALWRSWIANVFDYVFDFVWLIALYTAFYS